MDAVRFTDLVAKLAPYKRMLDDLSSFAEWASSNENYEGELKLQIENDIKAIEAGKVVKKGLEDEIDTLRGLTANLNQQFDLRREEIESKLAALTRSFNELEVLFTKKQQDLREEYDCAYALFQTRMQVLQNEEKKQVLAVEQAREAFRQISQGLLSDQ